MKVPVKTLRADFTFGIRAYGKNANVNVLQANDKVLIIADLQYRVVVISYIEIGSQLNREVVLPFEKVFSMELFGQNINMANHIWHPENGWIAKSK